MHREILAQGMAFPAIRHHDALEIRVISELDAEQIPRLAFIPVCAFPDGSNGLDTGAISMHTALQADAFFQFDGVQQIDDLEAWLSRVPVHRGNSAQAILTRFLEKPADFNDC